MSRHSRFYRIKKPLKSDMNVVPYIDVMLVLLVIFMVTAPMITSTINVDLPKVEQAETTATTAAPIYIVSIDHNGIFSLKTPDRQYDHLPLAHIEQLLLQALQQHPDMSVMIEGDQSVAYGQVMQLMSSLQQAGLQQVGLITQPLK